MSIIIRTFKNNLLHFCNKMSLSNKELLALKNPEKIDQRMRGSLLSRARKKIANFNSLKNLETLDLIAKYLEKEELLETIDLFVKNLPSDLAREYFNEQIENLTSPTKGLLYLKSVEKTKNEINVIAKKLGIKVKLSHKETLKLDKIKNKQARIKEIKRIYFKDINFVLSRKIPTDKEIISITKIKVIVFNISKELRLFSLEEIVLKVKKYIEKDKKLSLKEISYRTSALKKIINSFYELGIIQKVDSSQKDFIQKTRKLLLFGKYKVLTTENSKLQFRKFDIKKMIYPYPPVKLKDKDLLKINPFYLSLQYA